MADKELQSRIIHKHDTAENWGKAINFIPKQGELIVYDADSDHTYERFKIGDGETLVSNLPFMPDPSDKLLVVTATTNSDNANTATTDHSSQQIISHINRGGNSILIINDLMFSYATIEGNKVGYSLTMVSNTGVTSEVNTIMVEVSGNIATINKAKYDPSADGFLKANNVYTKSQIDEKIVELTDVIESAELEKYVWYGECTDESDSTVKTITTTNGDFEFKKGAVIYVAFKKSNTATVSKLNIDGIGEYPVYAARSENLLSFILPNTIGYNEVVPFVYNGMYFMRVNGNLASTSYYGLTLLNDSVNDTSITTAATSNAVKQAYDLAYNANATASEMPTVKTSLSELKVELDAHEDNKANPHEVTASQVGADPAGTAVNVVAEHAGNTNNPHGVTKEQLGITTVTNGADGLMSAADKNKLDEMSVKLAGIEEDANNYTHPTYSAQNNGLYKIAVDSTGHVYYTGTVTKDDVTALGIPSQDTTYSAVSADKDGLMSASDKTKLDEMDVKLDGIEEGAIARNVWYGTTSTTSATSTKIVSTTTGDFELKEGNIIYIKFTNAQSATTMKLNIDETGDIPAYAKSITSAQIGSNKIAANEIVCFIYQGSYFVKESGNIASTSTYGVTKLSSGINSTSTVVAATASAVKQAYDHATEANTLASEAKTAAAQAEISASEAVNSVTAHNTNTDAHNDIRVLISGLSDRLDAVADSDDTTLDQLSEIVKFIKSNKTEIAEMTTNKVNVDDIVNNLTTNVSDQPLSAAQGVAIKNLIDTLETELSDKADAEHIHVAVTATSTDGVTYTATVPGIDELNVGTSFIMIPSMTSTSIEPTLDVNGLGAIEIRRRLSVVANAQQKGYVESWLRADLPLRLMYDGTYWIVEGQNRPVAADLFGVPAAATKATQDANGNVITDTYATVEYVDTLIGIILNGAS